jgi:hypothetical protein
MCAGVPPLGGSDEQMPASRCLGGRDFAVRSHEPRRNTASKSWLVANDDAPAWRTYDGAKPLPGCNIGHPQQRLETIRRMHNDSGKAAERLQVTTGTAIGDFNSAYAITETRGSSTIHTDARWMGACPAGHHADEMWM